jgi:hypothetical protein
VSTAGRPGKWHPRPRGHREMCHCGAHAVPLEPPFPTDSSSECALSGYVTTKTFSKDRGQTAACMKAPIAEDTHMQASQGTIMSPTRTRRDPGEHSGIDAHIIRRANGPPTFDLRGYYKHILSEAGCFRLSSALCFCTKYEESLNCKVG